MANIDEKIYRPAPIDTADVVLPSEFAELGEQIARNNHEVWAQSRIQDGWTYGERRDDIKKQSPCLVPYEFLPESEKDIDRNTASEVLKVVIKLGFKIAKA
ncbi:MAG: Ryanodine receptor Ryr [Quinella sp. 1Q7]|nr:Ryanodine receptor Ryr [Quinella sp. 1Q7]